jgi:hypothetical protein
VVLSYAATADSAERQTVLRQVKDAVVIVTPPERVR